MHITSVLQTQDIWCCCFKLLTCDFFFFLFFFLDQLSQQAQRIWSCFISTAILLSSGCSENTSQHFLHSLAKVIVSNFRFLLHVQLRPLEKEESASFISDKHLSLKVNKHRDHTWLHKIQPTKAIAGSSPVSPSWMWGFEGCQPLAAEQHLVWLHLLPNSIFAIKCCLNPERRACSSLCSPEA